MTEQNDPSTTLRLVFPQWQGADPSAVEAFVPEFPLGVGQTGYYLGGQILELIVPATGGPTVTVPVDLGVDGLSVTDGVYAREKVLAQLRSALTAIADHQPRRIVTLGGECSVSVPPFSYLAQLYPDDVAVLWIDAHPDVGTPQSEYPGYHAMAVSHLLGHGDPEVVAALPGTIDGSKVALVGLQSWTEDDFPHVVEWGLSTFSPTQLADNPGLVGEWLASTGCSKVAIHLDVDVIGRDDVVFGLGPEPTGLSRDVVTRIMADAGRRADVVAVSVAEYLPRQVIAVREFLRTLPLLGESTN
ncbi:MAG TPA: arginase family protein [Pseudolysinimonas sp.]|nr:arginase family protein [Pseudolysinimonas sp.]